jgi:hypothetical protein
VQCASCQPRACACAAASVQLSQWCKVWPVWGIQRTSKLSHQPHNPTKRYHPMRDANQS